MCLPNLKILTFSVPIFSPNNPNTIKSYKILQKLSPKHAAHGVAQSTYPIYRHGKACLSKQPHWRAAGDPRLARGRSRVRAPGPAGALRTLFFSTLPSFLLREIVFLHLPHQPRKSVRVNHPSLAISIHFLIGKHPILPKLGAFKDNLLKIQPIF